jgi:uncharacterized phage protein gp47/JayE
LEERVTTPAVPTTAALRDTIVAQLSGSISQSVPLLPKAFTRVLAAVLAAAIVIVYKYAGWIFLQLFVAHATDKETEISGKKVRPLVEWGRLIGVGDPNPASRAELLVAVTVLTQDGDLAAGLQLVRTETQFIYTVVSSVPLDAATVQVTIRAESSPDNGDGSGDLGNLQPGDKLSFINPPAKVAREVTVVSQIVTASDAEETEAYRSRIFRRFQRRPQGGAYADYEAWGSEVPGIVAVYPYTGLLPGEVDVFVEANTDEDPDGIPTQPQLDAVAAAIELSNDDGKATRRPANAAVNVLPITRVSFDIEVSGLQPDTPATRQAIQDGVDEHLREREPFIVGLSSLPRRDRITLAAISGIVDSIASANGASVSAVRVTPGQAYTLDRGQKAKRGSTTFILT